MHWSYADSQPTSDKEKSKHLLQNKGKESVHFAERLSALRIRIQGISDYVTIDNVQTVIKSNKLQNPIRLQQNYHKIQYVIEWDSFKVQYPLCRGEVAPRGRRTCAVLPTLLLVIVTVLRYYMFESCMHKQ